MESRKPAQHKESGVDHTKLVAKTVNFRQPLEGKNCQSSQGSFFQETLARRNSRGKKVPPKEKPVIVHLTCPEGTNNRLQLCSPLCKLQNALEV